MSNTGAVSASGAHSSGSLPRFGKAKGKGKGKGKGKTKIKAHLVQSSPFYSLAACEAYVSAHPPRPAQRPPRIGSWNVRWFPTGSKDGSDAERQTDVPWLACTIAAIDVDVLAVQEFLTSPEGRNATQDLLARLDRLTKGRWRSAFDDCPGSGRQHVGFLYDESRVQISHAQDVGGLNPGNSPCDRNLRPGFGLYARFKNGPDLSLVSVHFDSGPTRSDFENRQNKVLRIGDVAKSLATSERDADLLVLGDFNVMGCAECDPALDSAGELSGIDKQLEPIALRRVPLPSKRECTEYETKGNVTAQLDLVLASAQMEEVAKDAQLEPSGICRDLRCKPPYKAEKPVAFDRLSDHCPLVIELGPTDADPSTAPAARGGASTAPASKSATSPTKPQTPATAAAKPALPTDAPPKPAAAKPAQGAAATN